MPFQSRLCGQSGVSAWLWHFSQCQYLRTSTIKVMCFPLRVEQFSHLYGQRTCIRKNNTRFIEKYCKQRPKVEVDTVLRMKVYLSLPYKGDNVTTVIKRRLNLAIRRISTHVGMLDLNVWNVDCTPDHYN